jgi:ribosome hibernation promoting factor
MDILVQAEGVTVTEAIKNAVDEKIGRVEHYAPRAVRARVNLRKVSAHPSPSQFTVRVLVEIPGADLSAEESSDNVISALDVVEGKIEQRLRKRKTQYLAKRVDGPRRKS